MSVRNHAISRVLIFIVCASGLAGFQCLRNPGAPPAEGNYFDVQTMEGFLDLRGSLTTFKIDVQMVLSWVDDIYDPNGEVPLGVNKIWGPVMSRGYFRHQYNPRLPASWRMLAMTGPCASQYLKNFSTVPPSTFIAIRNRRGVVVGAVCVTDRPPIIISDTYDAEGNLIAAPAAGNYLGVGQSLGLNQRIVSSNGAFALAYQGDGDLVIYDQSNIARWKAGTAGTDYGHAIMQSDGNFVVYDAYGVPQWHTNTWGNPGANLVLHIDGNLVVHGPNGIDILWQTGAAGALLGRYKCGGENLCYWHPTDTGPDQCSPPSDPVCASPSATGRYKCGTSGTCYWDANDSGPNQCNPPTDPVCGGAPTGRYKCGSGGTCYWDANDSGPDQCSPPSDPVCGGV